MASTYAGRLKKGVHYGTCGLPEVFDSPREMHHKATTLAKLMKQARHVVVFTGAGTRVQTVAGSRWVGASTSAGIPDFRGPNGVWTREQKREKAETANAKRSRSRAEAVPPPSREVSFEEATPTFTHMAIVALMRAGVVKFLVSQNVDGLHIRSGVPTESIAELHGNVFKEKCENCGEANYLSEEVQSISFCPTGRNCSCGGVMRDTLLDWEDPLPEDAYELAQHHCEKADLVLCLGTSLRVSPANTLPVLPVRKNRANLVIVNLQRTPKDKFATLNIRYRCDEVMQYMLHEMGIEALPSRLSEPVCFRTTPANGLLHVSVGPAIGSKLPFVARVELDLDEDTNLQCTQSPFMFAVPAPATVPRISLNVVLYLQKWCTRPTYPVTLEVSTQVGGEHMVQVDYYVKPLAPLVTNLRGMGLLEAQDDPEKAFKRMRKAKAAEEDVIVMKRGEDEEKR